MNKMRRFLAVIALVATLSGLSLQGMGAGLMSNTTVKQHVSSTSSAKPVALKIHPPCPMGGEDDC